MLVEMLLGKLKPANKVGCFVPIIIVSIVLHVEFRPNDHREDSPHCTCKAWIEKENIKKYFRDATNKDPFEHITFTFKENVRCFPNTGYEKE